MKEFKLELVVQEYASLHELPDQYQQVCNEAIHAMDTAYAPYSKFHVGAAVLLDDSTIVQGSNQENAAFPSGLCAERVAFFSAASRYPGKIIKAVAITTSHQLDSPIAPCGACRQVMAEYELKQNAFIPVIMLQQNGKVHVVNSVKEMLPLYFSGEWLRDEE